jgi:hypothetical protein
LSLLASITEGHGSTKEQLNDPDWRARNLKPAGTEVLYPAVEVMKMLPKLVPQEVALVELYNIVANSCVNLKTFDAIVQLIQRAMSAGSFSKDVKSQPEEQLLET